MGRPICGDCCAEQVARAFVGFDGVDAVEMEPGQIDFTVRLGPQGPTDQQLVDALVASGALEARVSARAATTAAKVWVVAQSPR